MVLTISPPPPEKKKKKSVSSPSTSCCCMDMGKKELPYHFLFCLQIEEEIIPIFVI